MDNSPMQRLKVAGIIAVTIAVVAQLIRPERTNPLNEPGNSIRSDLHILGGVLVILERSCFDCHSNETRGPWYSALTPVNFLIVEDVNAGRKRLNCSKWESYTPMRKQGLLERIHERVSSRPMPLPRYLYLHPGGRLSDTEVKVLSEWATSEQSRVIQEDILDMEKGSE